MAQLGTTSPAELLVELSRDGAQALHRQLEQELRLAIRSGRLAAGAALPSTRTLAEQLGLTRGVVVEAYEQLVAEGYLTSRRGSATTVSDRVAEAGSRAPLFAEPPTYRVNFAYGEPDVSGFPRASWLQSMRRVLNVMPAARLSYLDPRGASELRQALAAYLNRVRGTAADAEQIIITSGFAQALNLVVEALRTNGMASLGVEEPGQTDSPQAAARVGLQAVPIQVDEDGVRVDLLRKTGAEAVVVTPAHHFPTGAVLSADRRAALVAWARDGHRLILEDDYDAEYRYDREPIGALQGLAPEHVLYAGSASKTLAPGLRLGWLIAPADLVRHLATAKQATDRGSASLEQLAFADFLSRGEFDRHLRRMRAVYRRRREQLLDALRRYAPDLRPAGASAGLHVVAWLPLGVSEATVVQRAADLGVRVDGIGKYRLEPGTGRGGLLFGYGTVTEPQIEQGVRLVTQAIDSMRPAGRT